MRNINDEQGTANSLTTFQPTPKRKRLSSEKQERKTKKKDSENTDVSLIEELVNILYQLYTTVYVVSVANKMYSAIHSHIYTNVVSGSGTFKNGCRCSKCCGGWQ